VLPWRDDLLLLAAGSEGLHIVRMTDGQLEPLAKHPTRGFAKDVAFHGDRIFVAESLGGLSIWQRTAGHALTRIGGYEVPGQSIHQVVLADQGRAGFLAVGQGKLHVVSFAADGKTTLLLTDSHPGLFYRRPLTTMAKDDRSVLAQWHVTGLYEYAVHDGSARFTGFHYPHGIGTEGGTTLWGDGWIAITRQGILPLLPGEKRSPTEVGILTVEERPLVGKASTHGDTLFVSDPFRGHVTVLDLRDRSKPRLLAKLDLDGHPGHIRVHQERALIPAGHDGLLAWDWRR
jgi:hypothetical protein